MMMHPLLHILVAVSMLFGSALAFNPSSPGRRTVTSLGYIDEPSIVDARYILRTPEERQASLRRPAEADRRRSSVISLNSIEDYNRHVLQNPDRLHIIRVSAPWCRVCHSTAVAWERMASKLAAGDSPIQFFSVEVDGKNEEAAALKDMLQIDRVPQGIIHHPTFGRRIDMHRKNLMALKKSLESYPIEELHPDRLESF
mmetsp:Transcript_14621/g.32149  ORF Transcript_14621/g.32149 Transcript_14621/m.32149 type:complete len:199 (-) Transcript_14621:153-749(-)